MVRSRSIVGVTLVVSALVLLAAGSVAYRSMATLSATASALVSSKDRVLALEQVLAVIRDAETGQRGFLLTQQPEYLQPYRESLDRLERRLARVAELYAGDERAESTLRGLRTLVDDKLAELARTIELARSGAREGALSLVLSDEGKNSMDAIRTVFEAMEQAEERESERRLADEQAARRATSRSILALTGLAILISGVLLYVTRRTSTRIRESEQHLATTLRSIGDAVITTDDAGRITLMNPIAETLTGWRAYAALGRPLSEVFRIVNEHTREPMPSPVDKVLREGKIVSLANHTLLIRRDGTETPIEDSAAPITGNGGGINGVVLVFRDATGAREAERALLEADRRKDEFLAVLAHELRNPLAPIRQAAVIARAPNATDAQVRWSHEVIDRQVGHMARLLDDLLDVSRITRGTLEIRKSPVELAAVIESAIEMADPLIEVRRHTLDIDLPAEPVVLNADPLRIAQVVGNLLTNAAKYTRPGGKLRLEARAEGYEVVIKVADNGVGLAKDSLARLFEMFVQVGQPLDRTEGGLGIGLTIAKGLVELHGGSITAESAGLNRGSVFTVRLPLAASDAGLPPQTGPELPLADERGVSLRILVADDNRDAADSLAALLEMHGHRVATVHDGADALDQLSSSPPDLALIDVGMPKVNGYEVAERARAQPWSRGVTLVAVTGWGQDSDRERALAAGFDEHWVKPVEVGVVTALCERLAKAKRVTANQAGRA